MQRFKQTIWVALFLGWVSANLYGSEFYLRDGDAVVFYGDSITENGGYARLVEEYTVTRFPQWKVRFYYAGVGGDRVTGGALGSLEERLSRDVIARRPTVVTVMLGMNDAGYRPFDETLFQQYRQGYTTLVRRLKAELPGVRITVIQPSPFDDVSRSPQFEGGYDGVLRRYGEFVQELAREEGLLAVDFGEPLNQGVRRLMAWSGLLAQQLIPDRIHPGRAGHLLLGAALLRAWGAPATVTEVRLDAPSLQVQGEVGTAVEALERAESGGLRWSQRDRSLPLPLRRDDAEVKLAELAGAGLGDLNRQVLQVHGLPLGPWELLIDGRSAGRWSSWELERGIDLGGLWTPMLWEQSMPASWGLSARKTLQEVCRRLLATGRTTELQSAAQALQDWETVQVRQQHESLQPRVRTWELQPRLQEAAGRQ
ncbi:MAG: hypothetical protein Kow001_22180 [Acidobacteriota bacterium]